MQDGSPPKENNISYNGHIAQLLDLLASVATMVYMAFFSFFRSGEIIPLIVQYPTQCLSVIIGTIVVHQSSLLGPVSKRVFHIISILGVIYIIDHYLPKPLPAASDSYAEKTVVITGANSGVGFQTARKLATNYGCKFKCNLLDNLSCDFE
jgi:hypothetical protein